MNFIIMYLKNITIMNKIGFKIIENEEFFSEKTLTKVKNFWYENSPKESPQNFYANLNIDDIKYKKLSDVFLKETFQEYISNTFPEYKILFGSFVIKLSGSGSFLPLHQDWSFIEEEKLESINVWIPIDNITDESGRLFVIPKSHILFNNIRGSNFQSFLPVYKYSELLKKYYKKLTINKGSALVFSNKLAHGSYENKSHKPRICIALCCIPKKSKLIHYEFKENKLIKHRVSEDFFTTYTIGKNFPKKSILNSEEIDFIKPNVNEETIINFLK